jgi:Zn-dependent protease with chaperone function
MCSLLLSGGGSAAVLLLVRTRIRSLRREAQLFVLAAPVVSLLLSLLALLTLSRGSSCSAGLCLPTSGAWTAMLGAAIVLGLWLIALGGLGLGVIRLALLTFAATLRSWPVGGEVQAIADRLARELGAPHTRVRVRVCDQPLALTYGFWRPTVLISMWMLDRLDRSELEAMLAHELGHVARQDFQVLWVAMVLRDAFFYLPTSRAAYRELHTEKEFACDDLAVGVTGQPLGLASALAKVWVHALSSPATGSTHPSLALAPSLLGARSHANLAHTAIEGRITRLLDLPQPDIARRSGHGDSLRVRVGTVLGLLAAGAAVTVVLLGLMGCAPGLLPLHLG